MHCHISDSARAVGISRTTFYEWLKKDNKFAQAIIEVDEELNDEMKSALIHKAQDGDTTALIFWLRRKHPEFKDPHLQLNQQFNIKDLKLEIVEDKGVEIEEDE